MRIVKAATDKHSELGTTFYQVSLKELQDFLKDSDANMWMQKAFEEDGFDAIEFKYNLFGSQVIDGFLYLCITDGYDIVVNGKEVDPETALDYYNPETELSDYVKPATEDIILNNITEYELKPIDFDRWAAELLEDYSFVDLVNAAKEIDDDIFE